MKQLFVLFSCSVLLFACNLKQNKYSISSASMLPALELEDIITVDKSADSFTYGDIIAYWSDGDSEFAGEPVALVARIVGLPDDSIAVSSEICTVNGKTNRHTLVKENVDSPFFEEYGVSVSELEEILPNGLPVNIYVFSHDSLYLSRDMPAVRIPAGHYFVMGDFRSNSYDSRVAGTIPKEKIIGKVTDIKKMDENERSAYNLSRTIREFLKN